MSSVAVSEDHRLQLQIPQIISQEKHKYEHYPQMPQVSRHSPNRKHNLNINQQNSSSNNNQLEVEIVDDDESSFLKCNKKSLSLSIANMRLRDVNNSSQMQKMGHSDSKNRIGCDNNHMKEEPNNQC